MYGALAVRRMSDVERGFCFATMHSITWITRNARSILGVGRNDFLEPRTIRP